MSGFAQIQRDKKSEEHWFDGKSALANAEFPGTG